LFYRSSQFLANNQVEYNATYPEAGYPELKLSGSAWSSGKFVENSIKLACLEITGYRFNTVQCYGF
jgi:hypothetical protein